MPRFKRNTRERNGMVLGCIPDITQLCRRSLLWETCEPHNKRKDAFFQSEIDRLHAALKQKEQECTERLAAAEQLRRRMRTEHEHSLSELSRELFLAQAELQHINPWFRPSMPPEVPVDPQRKDALYWHQAFRTLQMQYAQLKLELDRKTEQCTRLVSHQRAST